MDLKSKIVLISGPTASGKSNFAIQLAKKINGEIVNADSMQVYKQLKILSARPEPKEYKKIKHHLYGFHDVNKNFSTGDWLKIANKKISEIKKRKKIPILVGGTGLYFKALIDGLVKIPNISIRIRNQVRKLHSSIGQKKFYEKLLKLDPIVRERINPWDTQRSIRAYEVKKFTNKSLYDWYKNTKSDYKKLDFYKIYIDFPRSDLIKRINLRTESMIKLGAIEEVKKLLRLKIDQNKTVNQAIGILEIKSYLKNEKKLDKIKEEISIKTRQYAKRQNTWARSKMKKWKKIKPEKLLSFLKKI